jgi:hypothetical protein
MHEAGASIKTIAATLGVGVGTVHRALAAFQKPTDLGLSQVDDSVGSALPCLVLPQSSGCGTREEVQP